MLKHSVIALLSLVMIFSVVGVVGAQGPDGERPNGNRFGEGQMLTGALLREASTQLDMTMRELFADVEDGQTINDVIVANGGDVDAISAAVKEQFVGRLDTALENGRITQERYDDLVANFDTAVAEALASPAPETLRERIRTGIDMRVDFALINTVADSLGMTPQDILTELRDGKTVGVIITENGGDLDAISDQIVAQITDRVNQAVDNGRLDEERATTMLADIETRVSEWLNRTERTSANGLGASTDTGDGVLE